MSWKRAVFFGGAVLVLAACDNATAPTSPGLTRLGGVSAASRKASDAPVVTPDSTTSGVKNDCNGSVVIIVGLDEQMLPVCVPNPGNVIIW